MAKKAKKPERLGKGEEMYFISSINYDVVRTHDCYFPTDDARFKDGNYFPDAGACRDCSDEIIETYVPKLDVLEKLKRENLEKYIKATKDISEKCKSLMDAYVKMKEKEQAKLKIGKKEVAKPDFEPQVVALVESYTTYKSRREELAKDTSSVKKDITEFIKHYPK